MGRRGLHPIQSLIHSRDRVLIDKYVYSVVRKSFSLTLRTFLQYKKSPDGPSDIAAPLLDCPWLLLAVALSGVNLSRYYVLLALYELVGAANDWTAQNKSQSKSSNPSVACYGPRQTLVTDSAQICRPR